VDFLKARLGQTPYDSPLAQPGCSFPKRTPTGSFGDIFDVVYGFFNIISLIFS